MLTPMTADEPGPLQSRAGMLTMAVVAIVTTALVATSRGESPAEPGAAGPPLDFSFALFDGGTFSLAEHFATDGRPVVLNFWASWCPPCLREMPDFDTVARSHPEVLFVGVAVDDTEPRARRFAEEIGVSYLLGFDPTGRAHETLPFVALPTTWIIDGRGRIVHKTQGALSADALESLLEASL